MAFKKTIKVSDTVRSKHTRVLVAIDALYEAVLQDLADAGISYNETPIDGDIIEEIISELFKNSPFDYLEMINSLPLSFGKANVEYIDTFEEEMDEFLEKIELEDRLAELED